MDTSNPFDIYRSARARSFARLQELRTRMDEWLTENETGALDVTKLALLEGLNAERDVVIQELQAAEARLMDELVRRLGTSQENKKSA